MKPISLRYCKPAMAVLAGLITMASCEKDKDGIVNTPAYLPAAIHFHGLPADSFTYNSKQQLEHLYYDYSSATGYNAYCVFDYNVAGKCVRVRYYNTNDPVLADKDTLVYNNQDFTVYTEDDDDPFELEDGRAYKVSNDGILLAGSKDTVRSSERKRVNYIETSFNGGNAVSTTIVSYLYMAGSNYERSDVSTLTYRYDDRPNGLQLLFRINPYAGYLMNHHHSDAPLLAGGRNNLAGLTYEIVNTTYTEKTDYTATNTYDPETGLVTTQVMKSDNRNDDITISYRYIPLK
ncbi:hypothetical protein [Chitinophaga rhizophila]|uniref:YD repeat-containing protein n=1 Tax=Chitinophaga rhizophila TaxID=2866212 RepID=A0ABS7GL41_9BACT|nr:hypothetical protein [Chitinophaga rhizophila]MBW8687915.1 hypothetical protein [Chitinophaga rhizophila]